MLLIAEVSDKSSLPDNPLAVGIITAVIVLVFGAQLACTRRWAAFLPAAIALLLPLCWYGELNEAIVGPQLLVELGADYPIRLAVQFGLPYLAAIVALVPLSRIINRRYGGLAHECTNCRYDLRTLTTPLCPECGTPIPPPR